MSSDWTGLDYLLHFNLNSSGGGMVAFAAAGCDSLSAEQQAHAFFMEHTSTLSSRALEWFKIDQRLSPAPQGEVYLLPLTEFL